MFKKKSFCDGLPFTLPIWHSSQQASKSFSVPKNCCDVDVVPDFGGHMFCPKMINGEYEEIKSDSLSCCPFKPKACLLPYRISGIPSLGLFNRHINCLVFDAKNNLLITSSSYNNSTDAKLIIEEVNFDDDEEETIEHKSIDRFCLDPSFGLIEQVNKIQEYLGKKLLYVRQEKQISVFYLLKRKNEYQLAEKIKFKLENDETERFFCSSQNELLPINFLYGSISNLASNNISICETNINLKKPLWKLTPDCFEKMDIQQREPIAAEYTNFHPKLFFFADSHGIGIFDTRIKPSESFKPLISKSKISTVYDFDQFQKFSKCNLNQNSYLFGTEVNLFYGDIRYPNRILMQWNHMLPTTDSVFISSLKSSQLINGKSVIAISNSNRTSLMTVESSSNPNLMHPISMHFPLHLPQFIDSYRFSSIVDGNLENYLNESKIVGFDFIAHNKGFTMFHMTQFGDVFVQDFAETESDDESEHNEYNYRYHSKVNFDENLKKYLNQKFKELTIVVDKQTKKKLVENEIKEEFAPIKNWWFDYLDKDNLKEVNAHLKIKKKFKSSELFEKNCEIKGKFTLFETVKENIKDENECSLLVKHINKLFFQNDETFETKCLDEYKWSNYSYNLLNKWPLHEGPLETTVYERAEKSDEQFINLSQYI